MKTYTHILFDLDHTIWDFEKNSEETIYTLYEQFGLAEFGKFSSVSFYKKYKFVNERLWALYGKGKISQKELRESRFVKTLVGLGLHPHQVPKGIAEAYLSICPTKTAVFPFTYEVLEYLQGKYHLHIITNGFKDVQAIKMNSSKLNNYFKEVVTSECCSYKKPDKRIFDYTLERIKGVPGECIMIGDNLECDVDGACASGIDQVFFNPNKIKHSRKPTHEISCLSELKAIL